MILSSEKFQKYEILTVENVLPEKGLLEKATTIKTFEYFLLGEELKAQINIVRKQYQQLNKVPGFDKNENDDDYEDISKNEKYNKSNIMTIYILFI